MVKHSCGEAAMGRSGVFEWHKLFQEGRERVKDDDRSVLPFARKTNQNVSRVQHLLNSDVRMSIIMTANELSISQTQVFEIAIP
ncbi:uncharacterized protein TNCV_377101 [Trichonephila clavipes]|nr:uncharacterized protein TNCV_377101 [Trichonephila clavipes]